MSWDEVKKVAYHSARALSFLSFIHAWSYWWSCFVKHLFQNSSTLLRKLLMKLLSKKKFTSEVKLCPTKPKLCGTRNNCFWAGIVLLRYKLGQEIEGTPICYWPQNRPAFYIKGRNRPANAGWTLLLMLCGLVSCGCSYDCRLKRCFVGFIKT